MKIYRIVLFSLLTATAAGLGFSSCQKLDRPELGEIIQNPTPPPYSDLKTFLAFENNLNDQGENTLNASAVNVTYVAGINGQAAKFGADGYILFPAIGDSVKYPNEFVGIPADTLRNLGSYTVAFWMNVPGPVTGGAQGVFSISNKNQFWGNLDIFLENWDNAADPSEVFIKVHMFNDSKAPANGEQWNEVKIPGVLGKWSHIAVTYDAATSEFSIFADGQPSGIHKKVLDGGAYGKIKFKDFNGMVLGTHQFQTNPTLSNHGPESWAKSINGSIDQFRLYNRSLSQAEVKALFDGKL